MCPIVVNEPSRTCDTGPWRACDGHVSDVIYVLLTVAFFVLAALLVGLIDSRLDRKVDR